VIDSSFIEIFPSKYLVRERQMKIVCDGNVSRGPLYTLIFTKGDSRVLTACQELVHKAWQSGERIPISIKGLSEAIVEDTEVTFVFSFDHFPLLLKCLAVIAEEMERSGVDSTLVRDVIDTVLNVLGTEKVVSRSTH
jgi:hypothetical protein